MYIYIIQIILIRNIKSYYILRKYTNNKFTSIKLPEITNWCQFDVNIIQIKICNTSNNNYKLASLAALW